MFSMADPLPDREPTRRELAAIEREWPQIEADLVALDVEFGIRETAGRVDELEVRRVRRACRQVLRAPGVAGGGEAA